MENSTNSSISIMMTIEQNNQINKLIDNRHCRKRIFSRSAGMILLELEIIQYNRLENYLISPDGTYIEIVESYSPVLVI